MFNFTRCQGPREAGFKQNRSSKSRHLWAAGLCLSAFLVVLASMAQTGQPPDGILGTSKGDLTASINQPINANRPMYVESPVVSSFDSINDARHRAMMDDSARLLALAVALKADVDKTNKDILSVSVVRKADEIEKLAHSVKDRMKPVGGRG